MTEPITQRQAVRKINKIRKELSWDPEVKHSSMEELLLEVLESLGYEKLAKIYRDEPNMW